MDVPSSIFRQIRAMLKPDQATSHHLTHHMHFFQTEKSERPPRGQQLAHAAQPVPGAAGPERSPREASAITGPMRAVSKRVTSTPRNSFVINGILFATVRRTRS